MNNIELKLVLESLSDTIQDCGLRVSDEKLFEEACKFLRTPGLVKVPQETKGFKKATDKQLDILAKGNVDHDAETISSKEASKLIDKLFKDRNKKK